MSTQPSCFGKMWDAPSEPDCAGCLGEKDCRVAFAEVAKNKLQEKGGNQEAASEELGVSIEGLTQALTPPPPPPPQTPENFTPPPPLPAQTKATSVPDPESAVDSEVSESAPTKASKKKVSKKKVSKKKVSKKKVSKKKAAVVEPAPSVEVAPENPLKGRKAPRSESKAKKSSKKKSPKSSVGNAKVKASPKRVASAKSVEVLDEQPQEPLYKWGPHTIARRFKQERSRYHLRTGQTLTRVYPKGGTLHQVKCVKDGYQYNGKTYALLNEVLSQIVGMREVKKAVRGGRRLPGTRLVQTWTVKRFFGLKDSKDT